jgi:hypothetical protein
MVVVGRPQSVQTTSVIGVLDPRSLDFFDHLIDDGDEIRKRFVAHGRIRPMWSKPQESAIEPAVDRPVNHPPTRDGLESRAAMAPSQNLSRSLRRVLAAARSPLSTMALASATAVLKLERFIVDRRAASAANPQGHWLRRRAPPTDSGAV